MEKLNQDNIEQALCDDFSELSKELGQKSRKEKMLNIAQLISVCVTLFTILMFYKYDINFYIKEIVTCLLMVITCRVTFNDGLTSGIEMSNKIHRAKDKTQRRIIDRMVKEIAKNRNNLER